MLWRLSSWNTRPHQSFSLITPIANGDQCATGYGEGNVIGAAANALLEVNGEGYFCLYVGKKENQEGDMKSEGKTEGHHGSSGCLVPIVNGWV